MRCYGLADLLCGGVSPYDCEYIKKKLKKKKNYTCHELIFSNLINDRVLRHAFAYWKTSHITYMKYTLKINKGSTLYDIQTQVFHWSEIRFCLFTWGVPWLLNIVNQTLHETIYSVIKP